MIRHNFSKPHKFNAQQTVIDGIKFSSRKEARRYADNKVRVQAGELLFFLRQVPVHLPGSTKLVVDFVEFTAAGTVHFVDTKGVETEVFKLKRRQVEELYPFTLEIV